MAKRKARRLQNGKAKGPKVHSTRSNGETSASRESIKAAEDLALTAFASGLKLAAAFGTVAAKTTSLALASIATGADKFSELIKQEALRSQRADSANSLSARSPSMRRLPSNAASRRRRALRPRVVA